MVMARTLLLNIGNTHTQVAVCERTTLDVLRRVETAALTKAGTVAAWLREYACTGCVAACVVPRVRELLRDWPADATPVRFLDATMIATLDFSAVDPATIGADRLANAVAAVALGGLPALVLDCGSAVTLETVDRQRRFRGGAIMPGRLMARRALHRDTGLLPAVDMHDELPPALGTSTPAAIRAGVDLGAIGAVERILAEARRELDAPDCPVLAVGGDAAFFARHIPSLTAGPGDFTLRGLAAVAATLEQSEREHV